VAGVKLVVIYPRPKDIEVFEKLYQEEHVPMAVDKLAGKTKFIATKVVATPDGTPPPFYRIAEVYFPSLEALQAPSGPFPSLNFQRRPETPTQDRRFPSHQSRHT
jgi:uncharacterized protein (TIGR02118 family)